MTPEIGNKSGKCCSGRLGETREKNTPRKYCHMGAKGPKSDPENDHKIGHAQSCLRRATQTWPGMSPGVTIYGFWLHFGTPYAIQTLRIALSRASRPSIII